MIDLTQSDEDSAPRTPRAAAEPPCDLAQPPARPEKRRRPQEPPRGGSPGLPDQPGHCRRRLAGALQAEQAVQPQQQRDAQARQLQQCPAAAAPAAAAAQPAPAAAPAAAAAQPAAAAAAAGPPAAAAAAGPPAAGAIAPQQQQVVAGRPYGPKGPKYAALSQIFLPGTRTTSSNPIPDMSTLMQCHMAGGRSGHRIQDEIWQLKGADALKSLLLPGGAEAAAAFPGNSRPGTLFLHLAQGCEFSGNRGNCANGKCKKTTTSGSLVWVAPVVCKHTVFEHLGGGCQPRQVTSLWLKVYCCPACAAKACSKGDGRVDPCTPLPQVWPYSKPVQAAGQGGAGAQPAAAAAAAGAIMQPGTGQPVKLTWPLQERLEEMERRLQAHQQQQPPRQPRLLVKDDNGLCEDVVQQLKQWAADDGRQNSRKEPLGEGLVLTEGLRMVLEGLGPARRRDG